MQEFNLLLADLKAVLLSRKREAGLRRNEQFIICLDHATVHNQAEQILGPGWQLLPHPPHSPDCNKPVEHIHAQLDLKMKKWLVDLRVNHPGVDPTVEQCKSQLLSYFNAIPTTSIAADISTVPATWQEIVNQGGGYVCPRLS
jgi:hypothetical protein